jgi:membrane glycosyltransferase
VQPERAIAEARIRDAESADDVIAFIQPKEAMALLGDRGLIAMFAQLPEHSTAA